MRKASDILKAIREDVFGYSQRGLAESLGYAEATVCRLESGKPQHRLSAIHLEKLRGLNPPRTGPSFSARCFTSLRRRCLPKMSPT